MFGGEDQRAVGRGRRVLVQVKVGGWVPWGHWSGGCVSERLVFPFPQEAGTRDLGIE